MTKFQIENKLNVMLNKQYTYKLKEHRVFRFTVTETEFKITTDKADLVISHSEAEDFFNNFLLIDESKPFIPSQEMVDSPWPSKRANDPVELALPQTTITSNADQLSKILLGNIEKLKEDPSFIPQAQAINESMKVFIDLAKTEVELIKAIRR